MKQFQESSTTNKAIIIGLLVAGISALVCLCASGSLFFQASTPSDTATSTPIAVSTPVPTQPPAPATPAEPIEYTGWRGEYFNNTSLAGEPVLVRGRHVRLEQLDARGEVLPDLLQPIRADAAQVRVRLRNDDIFFRLAEDLPDLLVGGEDDLGAIGGTYSTPIINTPEVAILGVSRAAMKPVYVNGKFEPRLMLPYSLSYDHRVIDGVAGAEFTQYLSTILTDIRHILL